ncbi:hypothetical protein BBJ29_008394 [Phytophthora kernoviae]|uniref:Mediator complex subunit 15 KIX domain-containing protein n=1 Tax=Phytophthora kernoviae TaxID=325452 RepID=A0A3F2RRA3_9STRA|nr:hypothetical protein BBP00_00004883 [Phytophthora kernoviae]RLN64243.1 hypothetical protein BBJ29_008394 [Phytophthora kernoviae]
MQTAAGQSAPGADWRIQLTREHRANLIAKIYNEMVRVSADPVPGIKLWMNVSWYELTLYKESLTQEEYINKIFTRLKSLRAQQTDMNAVMAAQTLPNQGMLSRLDFSYYNSLNLNQRAGGPSTNGGQVGGYPGHPQFSGPAGHPGAQQPQPGKPMPMASGGMPAASNGATSTPQAAKTEAGLPGDVIAEYWRQHAALKTKYHDDVEKVHNAFKKYVDHMKGHDETEQKKKLRYLLSYVQLCASILNEDKTTHPPRKIEELDKVYKYIVKIVNPYLKKLRTETDKRSFTPSPGNPNTASGGQAPQPPQSQQLSQSTSQHQHQQEAQTQARSQQQLKTQAQPQAQSQQGASHQHAQQPTAASREGAPLNVGLDDSLYGGMDSSGLLQMPSNLTSSASSSSFMGFPNDLSPTNFSSMDLLDMDGSGLTGLTYDGHDGNNSSVSGASGRNSSGGGNNASGGDSSDLGFLEAL